MPEPPPSSAAGHAPVRLVLDTNVVLDCLVFRDPGVASILAAIDSRAALAITNDPCTLELERVLGYPEIAAKAAGEATLSAYRSLTTRHDALQRSGQLPRCRDPDDQKFLELARDARADYLVTKDKALLILAKRRSAPLGFRIVTPTRLAGLIATS